ncbi:MAG: M48 family metalloprotease [Ectothiorhodospira sp.]
MPEHPGNRILQRRMTRRDFLWLMSAASAGVAVPALHGCATDPVTGEQRLMLMSEAQEVAIDRQQAPHQFSNDYGVLRDAAVSAYVKEVGMGVARVSHRPDMPYDHHVVNANYINAYTFPGGTMACTRGIMVEMEDEAELGALLGHETGHVNARHSARRYTKGVLASLALGGLGIAAGQSEQLSGYSNLIYAVSAVGATALLAHYSRENEREADALGLEYMVKAGHNPEGMVGLMDHLRAMSDHEPNAIEAMFSTHPMSQERYDTARREARERYGAAMDRTTRRERYMDQTASLRRLKPVIEKEREGEALMAKERPSEAAKHFEEALRREPEDYPGLVLMAKAQSAQGRHREAQRYLEAAREAYPEEGQAIHLSGVNQLALDNPEAALAQFQRYESLLPGNPNTVFLQGVAYEGMQNRRAAATRYQRYLEQVGTGTPQGRFALQRLQQWQ